MYELDLFVVSSEEGCLTCHLFLWLFQKPIGIIGLSFPSHMLELTKSNLSSKPRTAQQVTLRQHSSSLERQIMLTS